MYQKLGKFIIKHNILINSQYGFRGGHNTQNAILDIVNTIQSNRNSGKFTCGLFIDLKKAFDTLITIFFKILILPLQLNSRPIRPGFRSALQWTVSRSANTKIFRLNP